MAKDMEELFNQCVDISNQARRLGQIVQNQDIKPTHADLIDWALEVEDVIESLESFRRDVTKFYTKGGRIV